MLRKTRIVSACLCFMLLTLLFLDFTGTLRHYVGWLARVQFLPAVLALNFGVVIALVIVTLLFGRIYCSIICPLGVFQDGVSWIAAKRRKNRFSYSKPLNALRYGILAAFVIAFVAGFGAIAALIAPYSAYGRIAANLFAPLYRWGNNGLASLAERLDSYAFYSVEVWMKGIGALVVAALTLAVIASLAWRKGRTWCNAICPVGTVLGTLARFSLFKPRIDADQCVHCGLCERNCKAACIDAKAGTIDGSRCVACMDCLGNCKKGAIHYALPKKKRSPESNQTRQSERAAAAATPVQTADAPPAETGKTAVQEQEQAAGLSRRAFISAASLLALEGVARAQEMKVDGGLAVLADKEIPERATPIVPPGALGAANLAKHCTACQLCVAACPNQVLRPSKKLKTWMQPEVSYERGYCRPECTRCSSVCPTGALQKITAAEKSAIQVGHAVWVRERCLVLQEGVARGNCPRHCPSGAIHLAPSDPGDQSSPKIPLIDPERCIGCGACEHLCPARPLSAIYVEGHERHREV